MICRLGSKIGGSPAVFAVLVPGSGLRRISLKSLHPHSTNPELVTSARVRGIGFVRAFRLDDLWRYRTGLNGDLCMLILFTFYVYMRMMSSDVANRAAKPSTAPKNPKTPKPSWNS